MPRHNQKKSELWNHFDTPNEIEQKAKCSYCRKKISYRGGGSSNLTRHLIRIHPTVPVMRNLSNHSVDVDSQLLILHRKGVKSKLLHSDEDVEIQLLHGEEDVESQLLHGEEDVESQLLHREEDVESQLLHREEEPAPATEELHVVASHEFTLTQFAGGTSRYTPLFEVLGMVFRFVGTKVLYPDQYVIIETEHFHYGREPLQNRYIEIKFEANQSELESSSGWYINNNPFVFNKIQYQFNSLCLQKKSNTFDWNCEINFKAHIVISPPLSIQCNISALKCKTLAEFRQQGICIHTETHTEATSPGASIKLVLPDTAAYEECKFVVGRGEAQRTFSASKLLLARASEVFLAMFYGTLPESDVVQVPDMEPTVFEQLLEAITREEWQPTSRLQAKEVYVAAHKYMVTRVLDCCLEFIWPASNNYLEALDLATQLHLDYLLQVVMFHICTGTREVFIGRQIDNISQASLLAIVRWPHLKVSEMEVFDAAMRWATARCFRDDLPRTGANIRAQLGEVLQHIRFLAMTEGELNDWPFKSGVLTQPEMQTIKEVINGSSTVSHMIKLSPFCLKRIKK